MTVQEQGSAASWVDPADDADDIAVAIERARALVEAAHRNTPRRAKARARRIARLLESPRAKALTLALTDRVLRTRDARRAAQLLHDAWETFPPGRGMRADDKALLRLAVWSAPLAPGVVMRLVQRRLRAESSGVVLDAAPAAIATFTNAQRTSVTCNINLLGEAILGDAQAAARAENICALIAQPEVDYVSVKPSAVAANASAVAFRATIDRMRAALTPIYAAAANHGVFVNLDMEEYKEFALTVELVADLLTDPTLDAQPLGVVLQAYLPDSHAAFTRIAQLACARRDRGGVPIKIRLVKGANLAAERVDAELHGWNPAPYATKAEVDASYKRLVDAALDPQLVGAVRIGIASHNLFDCAWAQTRATRAGALDRLEFEMLAGMADGEARALSDAHPLVLYSPVTARHDFVSALAYLVRRLDENTGPDNFLRAAFSMTPTSPSFTEQAERFATAVRARHTLATRSRRATLPPSRGPAFTNAPDADVTQEAVRTALVSAQQAARLEELAPIPLRIAGARRKGATQAVGIDPSAPRGPRYAYAQADVADIDDAVRCARQALEPWADTQATARAALLDAVADRMARERAATVGIMASDAGKTLLQADPEVSEAIDFARYYAHQARAFENDSTVAWSARGVVVITPPWNFPYAIPAGGVFAALAAGNTVILKPAPETVWTAWHLANQCWNAGVSPQVLQFVPCPDNEVGQHLITHPDIDAVVLTGSLATARRFLEWRPALHLMAETSGKNAIVITAAGDLDAAVRDLVHSAFLHAGQKCSAASLAIVEASVYDDPAFRRQLADATQSLRVGPAWDPRTDIGPLIAPPGADLQRALTQLDPGEDWLVEPRALDAHGHMWSPGVRLGVAPGSFFHQHECFGPVLGVMRAPDLATAIAWQNATPFGLTGGIHSLDPDELNVWLSQVEVGNAYINRTITGAVVGRQPFGGLKASAIGPGAKAGGPHYVHALTHARDRNVGTNRITQAAQSYARAAQHFRIARELAHLNAEHNRLRYLPIASLAVWVPDADPATLEDCTLVLAAAHEFDIPVQVYSPARLPDAFAARYCAPDGLGKVLTDAPVIQLRILGPIPEDAYRAAHATGAWVNDARPVADGLVECAHVLREQVVCVTNHRYGNTEAAPLPSLMQYTDNSIPQS
ncbi:MAG: bifunctional proline dehydrogenase/L-glutamate gamma-semialdehyde dehydrogenase [Acidimicrobiia bacterium]